MRARIIFRGLTLFVGERPTKGVVHGGFNMGTLKAYLISDPKHADMQLHSHKPYWGLIGRDHGKPTGRGRAETKKSVPPVTTIQLMGYGAPTGVTALESFLDYVPCLSELHWDKSAGTVEDFITSRVVIPHGTIRARDFITWDWHGNTPSEVAYMDTNFRGFGTNEVVVDIAGDDLDINDYEKDNDKYLSVTGDGLNEKLWPRTKGAATDEDMDPNTVEIVFTNLPARRRRALPWGIHFETLLDAAGYPRRLDAAGNQTYLNRTQYDAFVAAAMNYDPYEWQSDFNAMGIGQPFPFFINPGETRLDKIRDNPPQMKPVDPIPEVPGRGKDEGIPTGKPVVYRSMMQRLRDGFKRLVGRSETPTSHGPMGHDPDSVLICPHGRE